MAIELSDVVICSTWHKTHFCRTETLSIIVHKIASPAPLFFLCCINVAHLLGLVEFGGGRRSQDGGRRDSRHPPLDVMALVSGGVTLCPSLLSWVVAGWEQLGSGHLVAHMYEQ